MVLVLEEASKLDGIIDALVRMAEGMSRSTSAEYVLAAAECYEKAARLIIERGKA